MQAGAVAAGGADGFLERAYLRFIYLHSVVRLIPSCFAAALWLPLFWDSTCPIISQVISSRVRFISRPVWRVSSVWPEPVKEEAFSFSKSDLTSRALIYGVEVMTASSLMTRLNWV